MTTALSAQTIPVETFSGPRCDQCRGEGLVLVDAHHSARVRSFRCGICALQLMTLLTDRGVGLDRLEWLGAHPTIETLDVAEYVRKTFDGAIGDADLPFADADVARLNIEATLRARVGRAFTPAELAMIAIAVLIEWAEQERAARAHQYRERAEWLADFQAGRIS